MKTFVTKILTLALFLLFASGSAFAQEVGDYRSAASGDWSAAASWETFDGSDWDAASAAPDGSENITILDGHDVVVDVAVVVTGQVTVEGEGADTGGSLDVGVGSIAFDGGTYVHDRDGGSVPVADWQTGSTIVFSGITGNAPGDRAQAYYSVTWNNPGQAGNMDIGWGEVTLGGTLRVVDTGGSRFRLTNANAGDGNTITIEGDVIVEGGAIETSGSSQAAEYTVVVMGDVIAHDGTTLALSRASAGIATWNLYGDLTVENGAELRDSHDDGMSRFVFSGTETQTASVGSDVSYTGDINYSVAAGAEVLVAADTEFRFEDEFVLDGQLEVNGTFISAEDAVIELNGVMNVNDGGVYEHARDGGSIPLANWNEGSTVIFSGLEGSGPGDRAQAYYNVTWDNPGQASNMDIGWGEVTLGGTLRVIDSGSARFRLTNSGDGDGNTITIMGDVVVEGGAVETTGSGAEAVYTVDVMGDVIVHDGATLALSRGSGGEAIWNLYGDMDVQAGAHLRDSHDDEMSRFVFVADTTGQVAQSVNISSETSYTGMVNIIVPDSAIVEIADGNEFYTERNIINYGEIWTEGDGQMVVGNSGVYEHARNGGTVPNAEWQDGSTILFTGMIDENASNTNQNYHNIILDTPNMANRGNLELHDVTISGDIHVKNTASNRWYLTQAPYQGEAIFTILGDVIVDAGTFTIHGSGNAETTYEVHHYGSIYVNEGATNFSITRGSQSGDGTTNWYLYEGHLTMLGGKTQSSNARSGSNFVFAGEDTVQTVTVADVVDIDNLPIEILEGAHVDFGVSEIGGNDLFILHEGATMATGHVDGFDGTVQTDANVSIAQQATFIYNGTERQQTSFTLPLTVNTLVIDNEAGVDQSRDITITELLYLVRGEFNNEFDLIIADGAEIVEVDGYLSNPFDDDIEVPEPPQPPHELGDVINVNGGFAYTELGNVNDVDVHYWSFNNIEGNATLEIVDDEVHNGDRGLFIDFGEWDGNVANDWHVETVNEPFYPQEGDFIKATIWIKADSDERIANMFLGLPASGNWARYPSGTDATGGGGQMIELSEEWTQYELIHEVSATDEDNSMRLGLALNHEVNDGSMIWIDHAQIEIVEAPETTDAEELSQLPQQFELRQNYPNPFNPTTNIEFSLPESASVTLEVFNIQGQLIATLVQGSHEAGYHSVNFDASSLSSGIYLYRIQAGNFSEVRKMMLVK